MSNILLHAVLTGNKSREEVLKEISDNIKLEVDKLYDISCNDKDNYVKIETSFQN